MGQRWKQEQLDLDNFMVAQRGNQGLIYNGSEGSIPLGSQSSRYSPNTSSLSFSLCEPLLSKPLLLPLPLIWQNLHGWRYLPAEPWLCLPIVIGGYFFFHLLIYFRVQSMYTTDQKQTPSLLPVWMTHFCHLD